MSQTIDELFESKQHDIFELGAVLDIDMQKAPYYFKVIMINIKTKWNETVLVPPEQLRNKYMVGYHYQNGKRVSSHYDIKRDLIEIDLSPKTILYKNKDLFSSVRAVNGGVNGYNEKYFLKQLSYKIDMPEYVLIIPSYAVSLRYYFLSSSMKNAIMNGNLGELYYESSCSMRDGCVDIHIKKLAGIKDIPFLCRFILNKEASSRAMRHNYIRSNANYASAQISSIFPINGSVGLMCSYKVLDYYIDGKQVYYVLNIINDTSPLGFDAINYKQYSSKKSSSDIEYTSLAMPRQNRFRKRDFLNKDNIVRKGSPSSHNMYEVIIEHAEKDLNAKDLIVNGTNIYMPSSGSIEQEFVDEIGSNSFEPAINAGDSMLANVAYCETAYDKNEIIFALYDFIQFYDALVATNGVAEFDEIKSFDIEKTSSKNYKSKYNIRDTNKARKFLFAVFAYDDRNVYLVEVEQDKSWQLATWFFVSHVGENEIYDVSFAQDTIQAYIDNHFTNEKLDEYVFKNYSLKLIHHNHKKGIVDDIAIDSWCDGILSKILQYDTSIGMAQ